MRSLCLLRIFVGPIVLFHLCRVPRRAWPRHDLRRRLLRAVRVVVPRGAACRSTPGCSGWVCVAAVAMTVGLADPAGDGDGVGGGRVQRLPLDHPLPQQPGLPAHRAGRPGRRRRAGASSRSTPGCAGAGDSRRSTPPPPAWPLWLLRFEASVVYGASGLSKLVDPDWIGGTVTWLRMVNVRDRLSASVLPERVVDLLTTRSFHVGAAKVIVADRALHRRSGCGGGPRGTRRCGWPSCFHVAIQLTARVEVFSFLGIAALVIWAVPSTRDRVSGRRPWIDGRTPAGERRPHASTGWPGSGSSPAAGRPTVVDRDGTVRGGRAAVTYALSRLPVTAWFFLPAAWLTSGRRPR